MNREDHKDSSKVTFLSGNGCRYCSGPDLRGGQHMEMRSKFKNARFFIIYRSVFLRSVFLFLLARCLS